MTGFTIANLEISSAELHEIYKEEKRLQNCKSPDLDYIFEIACNNRDSFPNISLKSGFNARLYLAKWICGYCLANDNPPSERIANPKSTCTDPAIRTIVKATQGLDDKKAEDGEKTHNLFMSAENIQGNLLEEYISIKTRPYGFLWCEGNVLRAIDFCNTNGSLLLQVKNKSNTENSSSSNIRHGTPIIKWYRLGTRTEQGIKKPKFCWDKLNDLINKHKTQGFDLDQCEMHEDDYQQFLQKCASCNHGLITSL